MKSKLSSLIKPYKKAEQILTLDEYLEEAGTNREMYLSPAERLLKAIGDPTTVDTRMDTRLSKIFGNRVIRTWESFKDFYGMEEVIEKIVNYLKFSTQGLEEKKQILYLLGPVGGGKSSLSEKLKSLMESEPFYALAIQRQGEPLEISPVHESPLSILGVEMADKLKIPGRYLAGIPSPWALKRMEQYGVDDFVVVKMHPNQARQVAIAKTEPGDENNQDISTLVGKLDIRKLEHFAADDADAYRYNGGLCLGNRGILEFVEMFKAPIKVLNPLLTATQEANYKGTEALAPIPFEGIILAHSNEAEWDQFKENSNNEAFLDRVYMVKVPYCVRASDEKEIYKKLIANSDLQSAPTAPYTLEMLAELAVLTRIDNPDNSNKYSKMKVYDGVSFKDKDPGVKSLKDYKEGAGSDEAFYGMSTRDAFKILSQVFNYDTTEVGANPVHLLSILEKKFMNHDYDEQTSAEWMSYVQEYLAPRYHEHLSKDIQTAFIESASTYGQSMFDRYIQYADFWIQDIDYLDPDTGQLLDREALNDWMEKIEKKARIASPKDFRHEIVNYCLRYRTKNNGSNPLWTSYEKLKQVIEANIFESTEALLPVISLETKKDSDTENKHKSFMKNMAARGYTEKQAQLVVQYYEQSVRRK